MTFYWWSHWFWITLLALVLLPPNASVHTYPSQEYNTSLEYNQNSRDIKTGVTKLYQTSAASGAITTITTAITSTTSIPRSTSKGDEAPSSATTTLATVVTSDAVSGEEASVEGVQKVNDKVEDIGEDFGVEVDDGDEGDSATEQQEQQEQRQRATLLGVEAFEEVDPESDVSAGDGEDVDLEYKRSAENYNKNNNNSRASADDNVEIAHVAPLSVAATNGTTHDDGALSNYTNFSSSAAGSLNGPNNTNSMSSASNNNNSNMDNNHGSNSSGATDDAASIRGLVAVTATTLTAARTTVAAAPAVPRIETAAGSAAEWINAELAAATSRPLIDHSATTTNTTTDTTTINNNNNNTNNGNTTNPLEGSDERVPFTLENANKEDELRRAENEHRTRKSKTLSTSADYKHINRFINYSTDSKNVLARSASTASNTAAEYEAEESNISSEALSVQRTYFLDAGAISAICFTIFGVCCAVGTVGIVLYRRRYMNKPQALSEPDSSVYIDDSTMRVSDNSDEMYSLDNDSFLNSLEAMTIQNYWTDTVKHTKL